MAGNIAEFAWSGRRWLDALFPEALRRDQLTVLAQTTPINAVASMVNAAIIGTVLWADGPRGLVLGWAGTVWAFSLFQLWRWRRFRGRPLPATVRAGSWRKPVLWATLAGLLWSSALVFLPGAGPVEVVTLCVMFAGVAAGGAATLAVLPLAAAGFVLGVLAPVAVVFLLWGEFGYAAVGAFSIMMILTLLNSTTVVFRWFAEARKAQAEVEAARQRAERANQAKSEFLAVMSHELRTPLASVISGVDLLAATPLTPPQRELVGQALRSSLHLTELLGDILDLSKLEAGQIVLEHLAFDLVEVLRNAVAATEPRAAAKGLSLTLEIAPDVAAWRLGDPTRLRQVVLNLLTNAIKFTDRGGIRMTAAPADDPGAMRFAVTDTGIGIATEMRARIFEKFTQADQTITRRFGGAGLGLAICKQIVDAMGGHIDFDSEVGRGTTFWFTCRLPEAPAPAAMTPTAEAPAIAERRLRVLLVEDNDVNRRLMGQLIGGLGYDVEVAADGRAGIAMAREASFDVILMDIQMPGLDGLEATRRIRGEAGPNRSTPIVALTGNVFEDDRQSAMAAGFTGYLAKPVRPDALEETLARQVAARPDTCRVP